MCYGFEANPTLAKRLQNIYKNHSNVNILHTAVADQDGEIDFNISNNDGASSSIGNFNLEWPSAKVKYMEMKVRVPSINCKRPINYRVFI